jgi:phospholipid-binding lipoprotein MlaA
MNRSGFRARALVLALVLALGPACLGAGPARAAEPAAAAAVPAGQTGQTGQCVPEEDEYGPPPIAIPDPLEGFNRAMFEFNDAFYFDVVKPVAHGYGLLVPSPFRRGLRNAYNNLLFPGRFVNSLLQFNPGKAANELGRFLLNTVFGIGGLFDVAKERPGLMPQEADFGQTLGVWGVGHGFYFVIPILGPSSLRDGLGRIVDLSFSPTTYLTQPVTSVPWYWSWVARVGDGLNDASLRQGEYEAFKNAAVEPYASMRDAYVQYRLQLVGKNTPCIIRGQ